MNPLFEPPLPWDVVEKIHDHYFLIAQSIIKSGQEVSPMVFVCHVDSQGTPVMQALNPEHVRASLSSLAGKDALGAFLFDALDHGSAVNSKLSASLGGSVNLIVQINEAWMLRLKQDPNKALDTSRLPQPSKHPGRVEVLSIAMHMRGLTANACHEISSTPARGVTRAKFPSFQTALQMAGRFAMQDQASNSRGPGHH